MKNILHRLALLMTGLSLVFTSCTPDYQDMLSSEEVLSRNSWNVEYYAESSTDMTAGFSNINIFFSSDGRFACAKEGELCSGTWNFEKQNGQEGVNINVNSRHISIQQLNNEWQITGIHPRQVQLRQDLGGTVRELRLRAN
jgi:hypothetical protein